MNVVKFSAVTTGLFIFTQKVITAEDYTTWIQLDTVLTAVSRYLHERKQMHRPGTDALCLQTVITAEDYTT